jgi:3-hydroxyacyl-CoA dehydrogenase/enoyl-CoA hydratase/3-hydroxybutyryl-CoA epimerase
VVDQAMTDFGWAMGPFRLMDAAGIETLARVYSSLDGFMGDRVQQVERLWPLIRAGHVGYKGGARQEGVKGFYVYPEGRDVDPRVYPLLRPDSPVPPDADEIARRPVWQMVNEVAHCLAEGVVESADEADLGAVLGIGWPRARQGPLAYARQIGPRAIVGQLEAWAGKYGPRFYPSRTLMELT